MKKEGFTLFELLVVISIIGILVAVATVGFSGAQKRARDAKRKEDLQAVQKALEQYYVANNNQYIVGCNPGAAYLPGGLPVDPKASTTYFYSYYCEAASYCICARLEIDGTGNNSGRDSSSGCTWNTSNKNYFCVGNLQ